LNGESGIRFDQESVGWHVEIDKAVLLLNSSDQFKFDLHDAEAEADRELLCSCIDPGGLTNESCKSSQSEFFKFSELVQSLIFSGEDCLKTHGRQERLQFQLTMFFIAESVARCGLKTLVFSLVLKFFSRPRILRHCLLSLRILSLRAVEFYADVVCRNRHLIW
jgi:hypothetical protein